MSNKLIKVKKRASFDKNKAEQFVKEGIVLFQKEFGLSDYALAKKCGMTGGSYSIKAIRDSGSLNFGTMSKLGYGVGFKGEDYQVVAQVMKCFKGDK